MEGWPVQATDDELKAAHDLGEALAAQGLVTVDPGELCAGDDTAVMSPWDVRVGLLRAGYTGVRYEGTGEVGIADVTQVGGEVWVPPWMHCVVVAATYHAKLKHPDAPSPAEHVEAVSRNNVPRFAAYVADALKRLRSAKARNAMLALQRIANDVDLKGVHDFLFPQGWTPRELECPRDLPFTPDADVEPW